MAVERHGRAVVSRLEDAGRRRSRRRTGAKRGKGPSRLHRGCELTPRHPRQASGAGLRLLASSLLLCRPPGDSGSEG